MYASDKRHTKYVYHYLNDQHKVEHGALKMISNWCAFEINFIIIQT